MATTPTKTGQLQHLTRYHGIKISDAGVYRILKRNGVSHISRGTRMGKIHAKRPNKLVLGHQIQMDVTLLTFKGNRGEKSAASNVDMRLAWSPKGLRKTTVSLLITRTVPFKIS